MNEQKTVSFLEAKAKLEAFCAYQERCQLEIEQKLYNWNFSPEQVSQLIADLITNRFLDEERFAEAFVSGKFRIKKWGRIKIKSQLKAKRISNYSIDKGIKSIDSEEYFETIKNLLQKKNKELNSKNLTDWQLKNKLLLYVSSKGFESDLIYAAIDELNQKG